VPSRLRAGASTEAWAAVTALVTLLAVLTAMIMAPLPAFIAERFAGQNRATGFGLAQQIGNILLGGLLPLISLALVNWTGNQLAGVGYSIASLVPCLVVTWTWGLRRDRPAADPAAVSPAEPA
jgi:sugar phosphate permease